MDIYYAPVSTLIITRFLGNHHDHFAVNKIFIEAKGQFGLKPISS